MDDRRAALFVSCLALAGAGVRFALTRAPAAPGDVQFVAGADTPPPGAAGRAAQRAERLARPLAPGERVDVNTADAVELTRLPRVGPALAQRIVAWRDAHGPFRDLAALDSVPGIGPRLVAALAPCILISGEVPRSP